MKLQLLLGLAIGFGVGYFTTKPNGDCDCKEESAEKPETERR